MSTSASAPAAIPSDQITALLLAGGRGSRMGGVDKGLQNFRGTPLALHALLRLHQQSLPPAEVMVNANRNLAAYESFGVSVWPDALPDFAGPLAGFLTGLERCETPYLITLPCDVPNFPLSLCERLAQALQAENAEIAMAAAPEMDNAGDTRVRTQPVFCLLRADLLESLVRFTQGGGRKIDAWTAQHRQVIVPFDAPGDDPLAFANVNTLDELRRLESASPSAP